MVPDRLWRRDFHGKVEKKVISLFDKSKFFRHGDLLIVKISSIPKSASPTSTNIIAVGEKTGHNHELNGSHRIYELGYPTLNGVTGYFTAKQDLEVKHPEHNTIQIPKGNYAVVHEREYNLLNNFEIRVVD